MNGIDEQSVQAELQRRQVAEEAARRATDGLMRTARALRWIGWGCALIPVVGAFGMALFLMGAVLCFAIVQGKGNPDGIRQLLLTLASGVAAVIVWVVVNLTVLALFGAAASIR